MCVDATWSVIWSGRLSRRRIVRVDGIGSPSYLFAIAVTIPIRVGIVDFSSVGELLVVVRETIPVRVVPDGFRFTLTRIVIVSLAGLAVEVAINAVLAVTVIIGLVKLIECAVRIVIVLSGAIVAVLGGVVAAVAVRVGVRGATPFVVGGTGAGAVGKPL